MRIEAGSEPFPGLKLIQILGRGGFAEVWEATDAKGDRVAVKFMLTRNSSSSVKEMRMIQAVQTLSHKNLIRIHNVWSIPEYIVVSMEAADGSLLDMLDVYISECHTTLGASLVVGYLKQAAAALDFLNSCSHTFDGRAVGFQHCDVKPSNLLLMGEVVKLCDFGLCTPMTAMKSSYERAGTIDFAAPEVHCGSLSESSDQYSLAISYYYLRSGDFPFPTPPLGLKRGYTYKRPAADLSKVRRGERRVLERALDLEPSKRWPSCTTMMAALEEAVHSPDPDPEFGSQIRMLASSRG